MQSHYPNKQPTRHWDMLNVVYPVRKYPGTGVCSESIARQIRSLPEVPKDKKDSLPELTNYERDYNLTKELTRSQTSEDFQYKVPEQNRHNKHTSCTENHYIYPPSRRLADRVPLCSVFGSSEMRSSFTTPAIGPRLVTDKEQFKHPANYSHQMVALEGAPSWQKDIEPLDTTHEGYEKYLDPYLTTSRLHHRPYTADQLNKPSASGDVLTYYSFVKVPWTRRKPNIGEWRLPLSRPKSMYDREKFKQDFREIITHNKPIWAPGSFRTEVRDNFVPPLSQAESSIQNLEDDVRTFFRRSVANLSTNEGFELEAIKHTYSTEASDAGSGKPVCARIDPFVPNKRIVK